MFQKYKNYLYFLLYLVILNILVTLIYTYTNISYDTNCTLLFIGTLIGIFILSFNHGKKVPNKGLLNGMKLGIIIVLIFFIISIFSKSLFSISKIIYYGILILVAAVAAAIGINFKKQ